MRRTLLAALALCLGAVWLRDDPLPTQPEARRSVEAPRVETPAPSPKSSAVRDADTYAATRLREIKADPDRWTDVWTWRREFSAADTPELQREVVGLARQIGPDAFLAILASALASDDALVRLDAARSIALLPDDRLGAGIAIGVVASDADTRSEVMDLIDQVQPHLRPELLRAALGAGDDTVKQRAIAMLAEQP